MIHKKTLLFIQYFSALFSISLPIYSAYELRAYISNAYDACKMLESLGATYKGDYSAIDYIYDSYFNSFDFNKRVCAIAPLSSFRMEHKKIRYRA